MRKFMVAAMWAALVSPLVADEIVLTDGSVVRWVSLRDLGDSYDVETPSKGRMNIPKDRVAKFVKEDAPAQTPLAGATFTFDKKKEKLDTVNLIKLFDQKNAVEGRWKADGGRLVSPTSGYPRVAFPSDIQEEYDLSAMAQKESGNGCLYLFMPVKGGRVLVTIDGKDGVLGCVEGAEETHYREKMFKDSKPHQIAIHVRKARLVVVFDGKKLIDWQSQNMAAAKVPEKVDFPRKGIAVGAFDAAYAFSALSVTQRAPE